MTKQTTKRTPVFYDASEHYHAMNKANEIAETFKEAKQEYETILGAPVDNFKEFRKDILGYTIAQVKALYPAAFNLNLPLDKTLSMLSIDLRKIERADGIMKTTPHKFCLCHKTGEVTPDEDKEPYTLFAQSDEELERLAFCNDLISNLEKCHEYAPHRGKHNLVMGLIPFIYLDPQIGLRANHHFVLNGIQ